MGRGYWIKQYSYKNIYSEKMRCILQVLHSKVRADGVGSNAMKTPRLFSTTHLNIPPARRSAAFSAWSGLAAAAALFLAAAGPAQAVPSFARQMDMQCTMCHGEFPVLNDMGRLFKLSGYTMSSEQSSLPPLAVMLEPSYTHTRLGQDGGAAPGFKDNNNYAMTQASVFYAGRLFGPYATHLFGEKTAAFLNKFGIFAQVTYDGVGKAWSWDNLDLRYADTSSLSGHSVQWGLDLNNNPTVQDPWNTVPAWSFPFAGSGLAPTPGAAPLIDGGLAQQVVGVGAYAFIDGKYYVDAGLYRTLSTRTQRRLGVDPTGETQLAHLTPYLRFAYTQPAAGGTWELGAFALAASTYPGRDASAGTDHINDIGLDSEYQKSYGTTDLTVLVTDIHERSSWDASEPLGNTANSKGSLNEFKATVDLLFDKTYGVATQYFTTRGSSDEVAYADSPAASPDSDGLILEADYLPFNKGGGPAFWPKSNLKLSVQYTAYHRFDGTTDNIDGTGRSAHDNNTLYLQAWFVF
jgi:hypothetical protein